MSGRPRRGRGRAELEGTAGGARAEGKCAG